MIAIDKKCRRPARCDPDAGVVAALTPSERRRAIVVRRRQRVPPAMMRANALHTIVSGCISVGALLPGGRRQILSMLYPGDLLSTEMTPPAPDLMLVAMLPTTLYELPCPSVTPALWTDASATACFARQLARANLHSMALGRLTGEERVATVLVELALSLGQPVPGGYTFELPMSRQDLADYLAINPDTLSRIVSQLKSLGLITTPDRRSMIIKNFAGVAILTPLAEALAQLHAPAVPSPSHL